MEQMNNVLKTNYIPYSFAREHRREEILVIKFSRTFWDQPEMTALVMAVTLRLLMCGPARVPHHGVSHELKNPTYLLV